MADRFDAALAQVDLGQEGSAIADVEDAILIGAAKRQPLAGEGLGGAQAAALEVYEAVWVGLADLGLGLVVERSTALGGTKP